jgi:hypothetical protein
MAEWIHTLQAIQMMDCDQALKSACDQVKKTI